MSCELVNDDTILIKGEILYSNVMEILLKVDSLLSCKAKVLHIDLSNLTHVDSSAVALLLELKRKVGEDISVKIINLPKSLTKLIEVGGLTCLFNN